MLGFSKTTGVDETLLDKVKDIVKDASIPTIREIMRFSSDLINKLSHPREKLPSDLDRLFVCVPNVLKCQSLDISTHLHPGDADGIVKVDDEELFKTDLLKELESFELDKKFPHSDKVATQWLLDEPNSHSDLKRSLLIDNYSAINKLKSIINQHDECIGTVNGCIINCFKSNSARLRPHADDEPYIDKNTSICTYSIGATRSFGIFEKKHKDPERLRTYSLQSNSLFIMQPGSQECTKHQILPSSIQNPHRDSEIRYSISFRRVIPNKRSGTVNVVSNGDKEQDICSDNDISNRDTTLILGSSITKYISSNRLMGKRIVNVINLSSSGAKINDVVETLDAFFTGKHIYFNNSDAIERDKLTVTNVIINIGTNDVLTSPTDTNKRYIPIQNMVTKAQSYYPEARVHLTSVIPIPTNSLDVIKGVIDFNKMLVRICRVLHCYYIDVFDNFLDMRGYIDPIYYRYDRVRGVVDIHLSKIGLGNLCRAYIKIITNRFNPFVL